MTKNITERAARERKSWTEGGGIMLDGEGQRGKEKERKGSNKEVE